MTDPRAGVPMACSLTANEAGERVERWRKLVRDALLDSVAGADSIEASFRNEPAIAIELAALVTAERACCGFLHFTLTKTDAALYLTVTAERLEVKSDLALLVSSLGIV